MKNKRFENILQQIVQKLSPKRIYLFGSSANDSDHPDSDLDLLILLPSNHPWHKLRRFERYGELLKMIENRSIPLDAIILVEDELETIVQNNEGEWDLILEILEKGFLVYAQKEEVPH